MNALPPTLNLPQLNRRGLLLGTGVAGLGLVLTACSSGDTGTTTSTATGPAKPGGTLRVGAFAPAATVDPVTMFDGTNVVIAQQVTEYLATVKSDLTLAPQLAEKWQPNDDNSVWTFELRPGVTFSDGTPLDAATVKASFDRVLDPASKSAALSAFEGILAQGGVAAQGTSVVFTLERPFSDFAYLVSSANYNTAILKADYAGDFATNAIGTGPFLLSSFDPSTGASLKRNPTYWQADRPYLNGVEIRFFADAQAEQLALQGGELDTLHFTDSGTILEAGNIVLDKVPATSFVSFTLRVDQAPFDKVEVRQAIAWALDRDALNQAITDGNGQIANDHLFAPLFPAAPTDLEQRQKNPEKVAELLAKAGVENLAFTLTFDPPNKNYALVVQNQLKQVGIEVTLEELSAAEFYGGDQAKDTPWLFRPAALVAWAGRAVPSQLVGPIATSSGVWNAAKYHNPVVDQALKDYDAATTDEDRKKQASIIAKTLHEDVPVIITVWNAAVRPSDPTRFAGIKAHPSSFLDTREVNQL